MSATRGRAGRPRWLAVAAVLAGLLAACTSGGAHGGGRDGVATPAATTTPATHILDPAGAGGTSDLTVFGAASLTGVLQRVATAYEAATPGTTLVVSTGSSAALATQVEQGAPADVFLSADTANAQRLVDDGFASGGPVPFAGNELTIVVPAGNPGGVRTWSDLARPGLKIVAAGDKVPVTAYAQRLVANLARQPDAPTGFAAAYAANVVSREDDVKAVAAKIGLGEGDAGIVYRTDAAASPDLRTIAVPADANVPATYAGVLVRTSPNRPAAEAFMAWLTGPGRTGDPGRVRVPAAIVTGSSGREAGRLDPVPTPVLRVERRGHPGNRRWARGSLPGLAGLFTLFLALPVLALLGHGLTSGSLGGTVTAPVVLAALSLSLTTTAISLVVTLAVGLPLAIVLARRRFRGKWLVEALVDLPIILPPSVAGLGLLLVFGRRGLLGDPLDALGLSIPFTTLAVILAQVFVSAPFFVRSARAGIAGVDRDLEDAARVDGASEPHLFRHVTVPLASAALGAGLVMSWARSLGEFGATIMFAGSIEGRTQTLPLVVYAEFQAGDLDGSIAAAVILVLAALGVLVAVRLFHWGRVLDLRGVG